MEEAGENLSEATKKTLEKLARAVAQQMKVSGDSYAEAAKKTGLTKNMMFRICWPGTCEPGNGRTYGYVQKLDCIERALEYCNITWADLGERSEPVSWFTVQDAIFAYGKKLGVGVEGIATSVAILIHEKESTNETL